MVRRRKPQRASSGAPGIKNGPGIGPALNPIGMGQTGPGTKYLDPTVAAAEYVSPWQSFWDSPKQVERFSKPVRSRIK